VFRRLLYKHMWSCHLLVSLALSVRVSQLSRAHDIPVNASCVVRVVCMARARVVVGHAQWTGASVGGH
jgi:hypothetical protein